jgi:hypothetical protein
MKRGAAIAAPTGSPEFDLLCRLLRPNPDVELTLAGLRSGIDFDALCQMATDHGVRPQLIEALSSLSWCTVPDTTRAALEAFQHRHLVRVLSLADELGRLAAVLAESRVRFAAFKGAALASSLYGDAASREYNDIDLIVPHEQYGQAERVLDALGYRGVQGNSAFRRAFLGHLRQYAFIRSDVDAAIDLHWDFCAAYLPFPLAPAEIWEGLVSLPIAGRDIPTIEGANLALLLAGHGTKEAWYSLAWICDFAMLIEHRPDLDWADIHRRARSRRSGNSVLLGCAVAEHLLGTAVPPDLVRPLQQNARVRAAAATITDELRKGLPAPDKRENFSDLDLCDRHTDRVRAMLTLAATPTASDHKALPLPPLLWPLYRVTRPLRLAGKALASL